MRIQTNHVFKRLTLIHILRDCGHRRAQFLNGNRKFCHPIRAYCAVWGFSLKVSPEVGPPHTRPNCFLPCYKISWCELLIVRWEADKGEAWECGMSYEDARFHYYSMGLLDDGGHGKMATQHSKSSSLVSRITNHPRRNGWNLPGLEQTTRKEMGSRDDSTAWTNRRIPPLSSILILHATFLPFLVINSELIKSRLRSTTVFRQGERQTLFLSGIVWNLTPPAPIPTNLAQSRLKTKLKDFKTILKLGFFLSKSWEIPSVPLGIGIREIEKKNSCQKMHSPEKRKLWAG